MVIDGVAHKSCEHYYQYAKFKQLDRRAQEHCRCILAADTGIEAWSLGQSRSVPLVDHFVQRKAAIMYRGVRSKYAQHPGLAKELMSTTGPIEATASTSNWQMANACILERVRAELQHEHGDAPTTDGAWKALVARTGGPDAWTEDDARTEGCGGTCKECQRAEATLKQQAEGGDSLACSVV
jgi:predicted NAD-dependent protein-ADP-ribosyltransferase YbiA (DUF1768 family)